jgi:heme a synthase
VCYHPKVVNPTDKFRKTFARYAWLVLGYNVAVILWGAVVRATGSGAGCGDHWPLCGGNLIPRVQKLATLIEFSHRASSGVDVLLVAVLVYFAFRRFERGQLVRRLAAAAGFFTITEGLVGAALVLFGEVGGRVSVGRVLILSLHLVNTFFLLASIALVAWVAGKTGHAEKVSELSEPGRGTPERKIAIYMAYGAGLAGMLVIAITGTLTALADTLFPARSLAQGFSWDFSNASSPIVRLRIIHPVVAILLGSLLMALAVYALSTAQSAAVKRLARWLLGLVALQFMFGLINVISLTPLWMQLLHLLTADLIWITLVLLSSEVSGLANASCPVHNCETAPSLAEAAGR